MMTCSQCPRPAVVAIGPQKIPLCVSCHHTLVQSSAMQSRQNQRMMNFLMAQVGEITGFPQPIPFPETPIVNAYGSTVLNNITVSNSTIGVINTGSIQSV